jgi:hypothetical protein
MNKTLTQEYLELKLYELMAYRPHELRHHTDNVILILPQFAYEQLNYCMQRQMLKDYIKNHMLQNFMGYKIQVGYENKLILVHKDYPKIGEVQGANHIKVVEL